MDTARSYDINVNKIDFNILEVQTYTRITEEEKEVDWEEDSIEDLSELEDNGAFLDKDFEIKQIYEIEIFSKVEDSAYNNFNLAIGANATKCKVYLSIKEGSSVKYSPKFSKELLVLINKSKVRANILINIFDEMIDDVISKIVAHVRVEEKVTYDKRQTYLIAKSYEPTLTTDDEIILHYDKKEEVSESSRVNYSSRDFIQSVHEDELLVEYIKPKKGEAGRNCRGEYIEPKEPIETNTPTFKTDSTIKIIDNDDSVEYRASENGYITLDGGVYTIKSEVDIGEISFKSTGDITAGLNSEININVKEKDEQKDAVGSGTEVEVSEIDIDGNVGAHAKIVALKATVSGQTHKNSIIKADELQINVHRGCAYGKNIHITRVEHGVVEGDIVEVAQAIGGTIRAKEIIIGLCASHVKATASRSIEIKKLQGSENTFTIDTVIEKSDLDDLGNNNEQIEKLQTDVDSIESEIKKYTEMIKGNLATHNDVKKRLLHYKKSGVKMPASFIKQYKHFLKTQEHLNYIKQEYSKKLDQLSLLNSQTVSFQDNIFDARVINRDKWVGYNEVIFKLVEPPIELVHKPAEGSTDMIFAVIEVDDGEFEIQAVEE
ncbi:MAG: DUF342 domain-containing protein [Sulfurimonas sp.]|nr:DUF342 domain-containing protein [Sulfurimonas sp.]